MIIKFVEDAGLSDHGLTTEVVAELDQHAMLDMPEVVAQGFAYDTSMTSPNQSPDSSSPQSITIHWWGNPAYHRSGEGLGVARYLCNPAARASAHYVASVQTGDRSEVVYQLIADAADAWHSGSTAGNRTSIGIEMMPWDAQTPAWQVEALLNLAAKVVASLWHRWPHLRGQAIRGHRDWLATECPGAYYSRLEEIRQLALYWYDRYAGSFGQFHEENIAAGGAAAESEENNMYVISCPSRGIALVAPGYFYGVPDADHVHAAVKLARQQVLETQDAAEWDRWRDVLTGGISSPVDLSRVLEAIGQAGGQVGLSDEAIQRICDAVTKVSAEDVARRLEVTPKGVAA